MMRILDTKYSRSVLEPEHFPINAISIDVNHQNKRRFASKNWKEKPHKNAEDNDQEPGPYGSCVKDEMDEIWYESEGEQKATHNRNDVELGIKSIS